MDTIYICIGMLVICAIIYYVCSVKVEKRYKVMFQQWKLTEIQKNKKSNSGSKAVIRGQVAEQFYPIMSSCPYSPADMQFIGHAFDYLCLDGYGEVKDGVSDEVKEVVFIEIKTGKSRPSQHQQAIKRAIDEKRVRYEVIRL